MIFATWQLQWHLLRREICLLKDLRDRLERRLARRFDDLVDHEAITWRLLAAAEPRLVHLEAEARAVEPKGEHFCGNAVWYGFGGWSGIKPRLVELVGWDRGESSDAATSEVDVGQLVTGKELIAEWEAGEPERRRRKAKDERAGRGFLWTEHAYDVAYHHLYDLLPDCRQCGCLRVS